MFVDHTIQSAEWRIVEISQIIIQKEVETALSIEDL